MRDLRLEADSVSVNLEAHSAPIRPVRANGAGTSIDRCVTTAQLGEVMGI